MIFSSSLWVTSGETQFSLWFPSGCSPYIIRPMGYSPVCTLESLGIFRKSQCQATYQTQHIRFSDGGAQSSAFSKSLRTYLPAEVNVSETRAEQKFCYQYLLTVVLPILGARRCYYPGSNDEYLGQLLCWWPIFPLLQIRGTLYGWVRDLGMHLSKVPKWSLGKVDLSIYLPFQEQWQVNDLP